jgi:hypothetical protein
LFQPDHLINLILLHVSLILPTAILSEAKDPSRGGASASDRVFFLRS